MVGGNLVGGKYADRALMSLLYVSMGAQAVVLGLFSFAAHYKIAAAVNIGAFNLGNALFAWLGGPVIDAGLGYMAPSWVHPLAVSALAPALVATMLERRGSAVGRVAKASGATAQRPAGPATATDGWPASARCHGQRGVPPGPVAR